MKKTILLKLTLSIVILIAASSSCVKDDPNPKGDPNPFSEIADITTMHGDINSDIVVVNTQGGPLNKLDDETLKEIIDDSNTSSALYINVHQAQTKNPSQFSASDITFEQAKQFDEQSVQNLKKVVDHVKAIKGKTVYVLGISFGAFVTQELIADYGTDIADGYFIMVGRLDIDEGTWRPFSRGERTEYRYDDDGKYNIHIVENAATSGVEERNMARLAAGLGFNRYTVRLADIADLSKITYVYGDRDQQVGPLSAEEIKFLKDKGVRVILSQNGDHGKAILKGLTYLKETFGIQ